jgi:hypothetical protein
MTPLDLSTLDRIYTGYVDHALTRNEAVRALNAEGVTYIDAGAVLDSPQPPSEGYLAVAG